jgi:hypothetical protein
MGLIAVWSWYVLATLGAKPSVSEGNAPNLATGPT